MNEYIRWGVVAHAYNSSTGEAEEEEPSLGYIVRIPASKKPKDRPKSVMTDIGLVDRRLCTLHLSVFLTGLAGIQVLWPWHLIGMLLETDFY